MFWLQFFIAWFSIAVALGAWLGPMLRENARHYPSPTAGSFGPQPAEAPSADGTTSPSWAGGATTSHSISHLHKISR